MQEIKKLKLKLPRAEPREDAAASHGFPHHCSQKLMDMGDHCTEKPDLSISHGSKEGAVPTHKDTSESRLSSVSSLVQGSNKLQYPPTRLSCAGRWIGNGAKDPPRSLPLSIHLLRARNKQEQPEHNGWVTQVGFKSVSYYSVYRTVVQITVTPGTFRKHRFHNSGLSLLWMLFGVQEKKIRLSLFSSYGSF